MPTVLGPERRSTDGAAGLATCLAPSGHGPWRVAAIGLVVSSSFGSPR
jgi:hypothetical protein